MVVLVRRPFFSVHRGVDDATTRRRLVDDLGADALVVDPVIAVALIAGSLGFALGLALGARAGWLALRVASRVITQERAEREPRVGRDGEIRLAA